MNDEVMNDDLLEALRDAQRFGFFGDRPIEEAVEHSMAFVDAIGELPAGARIADLGSGGGLPGLVLADRYRDAAILLIDRREKRTDFLHRAVRRLGWDHVEVRCADVADVRREIDEGRRARQDVVTARGFGPPEFTLRSAVGLLATEGRIVISEPPAGNRWTAALLDELALRSHRAGAVRVFDRLR